MSAAPQVELDSALYQLGVIADVMRAVATADISAGRAVCGSSIEWFAEQIEFQHHRIELALGKLNRVREAALRPEQATALD